jgi:hypothetical protein
MDAVPRLGQRPFDDIQEIQTRSARTTGKSLNDIRSHRVGRFPQLTTELELLQRRKLIQREQMELDEEIVGTLPALPAVPAQFKA